MKDLLEAITILYKHFPDVSYPIHCEHDYLYFNLEWKKIPKEDRKRLKELGFFRDKDYDGQGIGSFKYGSF